MEGIRLNKYLSEMGVCSRREADRLIQSGEVLIDGRIAGLGDRVRTGQTVLCGGKPVGMSVPSEAGDENDSSDDPEQEGQSSFKVRSGKPKPVLLAVNKPRGIVCTTSSKDRAPNIVEMVRYPDRIYPVGRLDKDSEGLIFMTNQGDLVNRMMRGSSGHEKEYLVTVDRPVTGDFIRKMQAGLWLDELNVRTKPCRAWATDKKEFHIVLTQGLNRQIRRMCASLGYHVQSLRRIRIMNIWLGNLKAGTYRKVTPEEYSELLRRLDEGQKREGPHGLARETKRENG